MYVCMCIHTHTHTHTIVGARRGAVLAVRAEGGMSSSSSSIEPRELEKFVSAVRTASWVSWWAQVMIIFFFFFLFF
jgi:hypothetical protein